MNSFQVSMVLDRFLLVVFVCGTALSSFVILYQRQLGIFEQKQEVFVSQDSLTTNITNICILFTVQLTISTDPNSKILLALSCLFTLFDGYKHFIELNNAIDHMKTGNMGTHNISTISQLYNAKPSGNNFMLTVQISYKPNLYNIFHRSPWARRQKRGRGGRHTEFV